MLGALRSLDAYRRVPRDLSETSLVGALLTACVALFTAFLIAGETRSFLRPVVDSRIAVDRSLNGDRLPLSLSVSFPSLPCEFASVDLSDALGAHSLNVDGLSTLGTKAVRKTRLTSDGRSAGAYEERATALGAHADDPAFLELDRRVDAITADDVGENDLYDGEEAIDSLLDDHSVDVTPDNYEEVLASANVVAIAYVAEWCSWCKMLKPVWEHTAGVVRQKLGDRQALLGHVDCVEHAAFCKQQGARGFPHVAVHRLGKGGTTAKRKETYSGDRTTESLLAFIAALVPGAATEQRAIAQKFITVTDSDATGCKVDAFLTLKRVPGTVELGAHSASHSFHGAHLNLTHVVHHLSFGHDLTADDRKEVASVLKGPGGAPWAEWNARFLDSLYLTSFDNTTFEHYVNVVPTIVEKAGWAIDLYETTAHSHQYTSANEGAVRFRIQPSSFVVVVEETRQPLVDFVTNLCAVVGGVAVVGAIASSLVQHLQGAVKASFNKQS